MTRKPQQKLTLNPQGQSVVRVLIASYFMAVSLRVIEGTGTEVLFRVFLSEPTATTASASFMFVSALAVMTGILVRPAALLLALAVFWSSFIANIMAQSSVQVSVFWHDLALIAGLFLTYSDKGQRGKPMILRRIRIGRRYLFERRVSPRRISVPERGGPHTSTPRPAALHRLPQVVPDSEPENIFRDSEELRSAS